jgi:hypothetical protein
VHGIKTNYGPYISTNSKILSPSQPYLVLSKGYPVPLWSIWNETYAQGNKKLNLHVPRVGCADLGGPCSCSHTSSCSGHRTSSCTCTGRPTPLLLFGVMVVERVGCLSFKAPGQAKVAQLQPACARKGYSQVQSLQ